MAMHLFTTQKRVGVLLALLLTGSTQASEGTTEAVWYQLAERSLSLQEAAGQAQRQFGGKVIKADPVHLKGRNAYRIRMVRPDGRVREVMLDANSGKPLSRKRK